jgi:hypothetical protein
VAIGKSNKNHALTDSQLGLNRIIQTQIAIVAKAKHGEPSEPSKGSHRRDRSQSRSAGISAGFPGSDE